MCRVKRGGSGHSLCRDKDRLLTYCVRVFVQVTGAERPLNSLLEATMEHDVAMKPTPVITEEVTEALEDMIRRRIADELFDDVVRRVAPMEKKKQRSTEVLSQDKPKEGLAEVYEKEYIAAVEEKRREVVGVDLESVAEEDKDPRHMEIVQLYKKFCMKLDMLSALHFTPKVRIPEEPEPLPNLPAVSMEDAVPDATSDAMALAPREVFSGPKLVVGEDEMTKKERHAKRQANKARAKNVKAKKDVQRKAEEAADPLLQARKEEKLAAATAAKTRRKNKNKRSELVRSKEFFSKLQQVSKTHIKDTRTAGLKGITDPNTLTANKLKL